MADIKPPDVRKGHPANGWGGQTGKPPSREPARNQSGKKHGNGASSQNATWRRPPHRQFRQAYAAIDLGTNNCRLLIARPAAENFVVIDAFSRVVRLGEGLAQTGSLSQAAMDRAVGALKICADKLRKRNVHLARSVATEACRRADNGADFIERVQKETGIVLDIISAEEEARLAVLGCHILLEDGIGPAVIFDIGGGSTELVLIEPGAPVPHILDWQSVPWGVVSLSETVGAEVDDHSSRLARYEEMRRLVSESFAQFAKRIAAHHTPELRLLGTSGTVTTLASLHLDLPQYDRNAVDGLIVPAESMRDISRRLSHMSPAERRTLPCIGKERADLVVAGCAILEGILDIWPAPRLGVADRGIREGILRSMMSADADGMEAQAALRRLKKDMK
ncbi:exopolyphosphatase/guanosine-5'-triphosphate,3'-diphosphate pyrophosphatase [Altererythrobacter atlanticus]|nr:Ppx/GppA phosphatase family protein [Croceibacterium atlanticum]MBB5731419.1 exopolyphosphatase/guanosine-5'-triphosphate,3'-diphosphate pyrophosphatase [Croceibacterium atlanticum]